MSERGFVYFLPGAKTATRSNLEEAGLGYLFDGPRGPGPASVETTGGPAGAAGVFFSVSGHGRPAPEPRLGERARWLPIPGSPALLGVLEGALPGAADLARRDQVEGHAVELGDGGRWIVPVVRALNGDTRLPRALEWNGSDWVQGDVRPAYRKLWAAGLRIFDALRAGLVEGGEEVRLTLTEEATTAAAALALNYRVGPAEISALGLFDTRNEVEVLKALIDLPALEAIRGKAEAAGRS